jgi:hypothetical protein
LHVLIAFHKFVIAALIGINMSFCTLIFYQLSYDGKDYFHFLRSGNGNPHYQYSDLITYFCIPTGKKLSRGIYIINFSLIIGLWLLSARSVSGQCDIFTGSASISSAIMCNGSNGIVTMSASGGYTPYTFTFGALPPVTTNSSSQTFEVPSGTDYSWSVVSDTCPIISGILDLLQPDEFNAVISASTPACFNQSTGTAIISASGGTPPYIYSEDGTNYDSSPLMTGLAAGNQTFFIMDSNGCISTVSVEITSLSPLSPGAHNNIPLTVCPNYNPDVLTFTTPVTGGIAPYSYQWYLNGNPIAGASSSFYDPLNLLTPGSYSYSCTVSDGCGQTENTSAKIITVVDEADITVSGGGTFCQNEFVTLTTVVTGGTGTILYQWQESQNNITWTSISGATNAIFNPPTNTAGIYYFRVDLTVNGAACNDPLSNSQRMTVNPLPVTSAIYHQ